MYKRQAIYSLNQPSAPSNWPQWSDNLPKYINSKFSNLYVAFSGSKVIQSNNKYYWNFVDSGDGYFYILTSDNSKAITISGTGNGSDLILTAFNGGADNQKWNKFLSLIHI